MMNSWEGSRAGDENLMPKKYMQRGRLAAFSEGGAGREERVAGEGKPGNKSASWDKENPSAHWTWQICRPCFRHIPIHIYFCIHIHVHIYIISLHTFICITVCICVCIVSMRRGSPSTQMQYLGALSPPPGRLVPASPWSCPLGMIQLRGAATWELSLLPSRCEVQTNTQDFICPSPQCVPTQKPGCFKCWANAKWSIIGLYRIQ